MRLTGHIVHRGVASLIEIRLCVVAEGRVGCPHEIPSLNIIQ